MRGSNMEDTRTRTHTHTHTRTHKLLRNESSSTVPWRCRTPETHKPNLYTWYQNGAYSRRPCTTTEMQAHEFVQCMTHKEEQKLKTHARARQYTHTHTHRHRRVLPRYQVTVTQQKRQLVLKYWLNSVRCAAHLPRTSKTQARPSYLTQ